MGLSSVTPSKRIGQGSVQLGLSHDHSHFDGLRCSPRAGPCVCKILHTFLRSSTLPTMPPSSMYHLLQTGPSAWISFTRQLMPQQNYSGPSGSPCCTPLLESITILWS